MGAMEAGAHIAARPSAKSIKRPDEIDTPAPDLGMRQASSHRRCRQTHSTIATAHQTGIDPLIVHDAIHQRV